MGATIATRYALAHPEVGATVAVSLPDSSHLPPDRPTRLLLLVGGAEFAGMRAAAERAIEQGGPGRAAVFVPYVEHISILYAPRTHREVVTWLDDSFGGRPADKRPIPSPMRRLSAAALLMLSFLVGLYPLARILLGDSPPRWPRLAAAGRPHRGRRGGGRRRGHAGGTDRANHPPAAGAGRLYRRVHEHRRSSRCWGITAGARAPSRLPLRSLGTAGSGSPSPHPSSSATPP